MGLSLVAFARAALDVAVLPPLYKDHPERRAFQKRCLSYAERSLEVALSTDTMSELLLVCQFETWILKMTVEGEQSK